MPACVCHVTSACWRLDSAISDVFEEEYPGLWIQEVVVECEHCTQG